MGFAIQRGGTCTLAAVEELVVKRRASQLVALAEAAVWVGGGLVAAAALRMLPPVPVGYGVGAATVFGGVLLGLGAWVNGACILGAVARFGSGQWAYIVTPLGFFLGCLTFGPLFAASSPAPQDASPWLQHATLWALVPFAGFACWRLAHLHATPDARRWSPHTATTVIGLAFLALLLLVGAWAYTDVLIDAARGMPHGAAVPAALSAALLAGAVLGGWTAGLFRHTRASPRQIARCLAGGLLMGWGALLVPGGNDGLVLVGLPLLRPHAWLALFAMTATIALLIVLMRMARGARRMRP